MLKKIIPICSFSLISYASTDSEKKQRFSKACKSSVRAVKSFKTKCGVPGISVSVNISGKYFIDMSYGYCDIENISKCRTDSLMRIASISKSFTSIIAAKLVEEGLLDLDEDIEKYLPSFPPKVIDLKKAVITCRHLLSHRSGIRHYKKIDGTNSSEYELTEFLNKDRYIDTLSSLKMFVNDDLVFKPGEKFLYSSHGYVLLSAVLEIVAQKSEIFAPKSSKNGEKVERIQFLEEIFKILFKKLGLFNTYCEYHEKILSNRSRQYRRNCKNRCQLECAPYVDNSNKWASGGLVSTCQDLNKFAEHLVKIWINKITGFISLKTLQTLWTPICMKENVEMTDECYGLGWAILKKDTRLFVGHTGCASGGSSALQINLPLKNVDDEYVIVTVLCNMENLSENVGNLAKDISRLFENM